MDSEDDDDDETGTTVIERVTRFRGDDDDFVTPARPLKKAKWAHADKALRWDKGLLVIRDSGDGTNMPSSSTDGGVGGGTWPKGVFRNAAKVSHQSLKPDL